MVIKIQLYQSYRQGALSASQGHERPPTERPPHHAFLPVENHFLLLERSPRRAARHALPRRSEGMNGARNLHSDLLSANPADDEGKDRLIEEIKSRAKAAIKLKRYPDADMLYGKAIKVRADAILYSNRSLVRANMGKFAEALEDAEEAVKLDAAYVKGHYRKGNALVGLERFDDAIVAYEVGKVMDPSSSTFDQAMEKARKAADAAAAKAAAKPPPAPQETVIRRDPAAKASGKPAAASTGGKKEGGNMRGYRTTADGRMTTYFNNELTEEEKKLIGDITPQRIDQPSDAAAAAKAGAGSAWNMAGTFEERNCTAWAKEALKAKLEAVNFIMPNDMGVVEVNKVKDMEGDAVVTIRRGKKSYIFDFALKVEWEVDLDCGKCRGKLVYPDVSSDVDEGEQYRCHMEVDSTSPPQARAVLKEFIENESRGLRPVLQAAVEAFAEEYAATK